MAEDLAGAITTGVGVPVALGLGCYFVNETLKDTQAIYSYTILGPGRILTLCSIGFLVIMQEFVGANAPFGFSAIDNPYSPENGDYFTDGAQHAAQVGELLQHAVAFNWRGAAAGGYDTETQTLLALAATIAENDATMANLVDNHADNVLQTQFNLGTLQDALIVVYLIVWGFERAGFEGDASGFIWMAYVIALVLCPPLVAAGIGELANCLGNSVNAAVQATDVDYGTVTQKSRQITANYAEALAALTAGPGESTAVAGGATVAATPSWASTAGPRHAAPSMPPTDVAAAVEFDSPHVAAPATRDAPFIPVSAAPGQSASVPGGSARPGNRVGQQSRPAVAPPGAPVAEVDDAAARPAASSGERAPLEGVATGTGSDPLHPALAGLQP